MAAALEQDGKKCRCIGVNERTISVPIRVRQGIEHYYVQWSTHLQDDGGTSHVKDGETYFKLPELRFLGRRLTLELRFFSLVAC